ncbi:hypothetical protein GCM10010520_11890 [Rhizobium viscosum]|uniref:Uncharacterized protein n=1 Tax=Rhizobium viscosum TaxID=1673 RepID=A0ABR9IYQ0_RHIVS|nr:hypothetical protein [Rhizobium viscosum]MBE1508266.1 hypothetical protein [Rhizobium viscosum]
MRLIISRDSHLISQSHEDLDELERAQDLIDDFLRFAREDDVGNDLIDEIELPVAKSRLIRAFCIAIVAERRPDIRTFLMKAGLTLAQYQSRIGARMRVRCSLPDGRPTAARSRQFERRVERAYAAAAEDRIRLAGIYAAAITRSFN